MSEWALWENREAEHPVRPHIVHHLSCWYYVQSQINTAEAAAEHHTPERGLSGGLCGELGPVTPGLISDRVSRLPAAWTALEIFT